MIFLLHTNAISDLMRKHPNVKARVAALSETDQVVTSVVARGEIMYGIERLAAGKKT
jgi:predicted nucleic acid-binding protein